MHKTLITGAFLAITSWAAAQNTTVVPNIYATTEANTFTGFPFGLSSPCRLQYLYDSSLISVPAAAVRAIAFRGEGSMAAPAKSGVDLEIQMSATMTPWFMPSATFAANHGTNVATPFTRKMVNLPGQSGSATPAPFETRFPLDVAFPYLQPQGHLLIDYIVHAQPAGAYTHDTSYTFTPVFTPIGNACGLTQTVTGGSPTALNTTLGYTTSGVPSGGPAFHVLGSQQLGTPIPLPLGSCLLYQNLLLFSVMTVSGTTASIQYPLHPNHKGFTVFGQTLALNSGFTQLTGSQSHQTLIGGYDPHTRIHNTTSSTSPSGTVQLGVGIVTELTY
jgi:hypothetical protein